MKNSPGIRKLTIFLSIPALILLASCSREKNTVAARLYHSATSYFNGYYNASYLYKETVRKVETMYKLPEQGFIEVVYTGTEDEVKSVDADLEKIIKKNDVVMYKHPNGKYIDDCRLLNGQAWYYRKNYSLAQQNLTYVTQNFPESPKLAEAWFWLARNYYAMENTEMALSVLDEYLLRNDTMEISEDLQGELTLFLVEIEMDRKNYAQAAELLAANIDFVKDPLYRSRSHFLLGQLYTELKNFPRALEQYTLVSKTSVDYSLIFLSKIRIARLYIVFQEGQDDDQTVYKYLNTLLKDEKNAEYKDQIYYEFALLEEKKKQLDQALGYLRQSLRASVNNTRQKALSYYKAGQIYFYQLQNYPRAQAYYDSAATTISPKAPEYKEIKALAATLKDYIRCKETIAYQDSMLWLARLPEGARDSVVALVAKRDEERKKAEAERLLREQEANDSPLLNPGFTPGATSGRESGGGKWYFDNPAAVSNGRLQFQQVWGKRPNEDNWRRKNKGVAVSGDDEEISPTAGAPVDSTLLKQYGTKYDYYKNIPLTDSAQAEALKKIESSLYQLGQIYSQKLSEPDSAIQTFETLLDRFEGTDYELRTRYALYTLYSEKGNPIAEAHKNYILNEHPNTVYAYLILGRDPQELRKDEEDYAFVYDGVFSAYANKQYETSLGFSTFLLTDATYTGNPELDLARLEYIRGMSYGYLGERDSLKTILTHVVSTYPKSEVTPLAKKTLDYLNNGLPEHKPTASAGTESGPAKTSKTAAGDPNDPRFEGLTKDIKPGDKIFVLMYVDKTGVNKDQATVAISDFNTKSFPDAKLKVFTFLYKQTHLLPYISSFESVDAAKAYVNAVKGAPIAKTILPGEEDRVFYISHTNFKIAYGQKRMEDYLLYYSSILEP
ncbi:MAG: tetratricopeptide repeat protein [Bacteroidia bacterium]|nr:tetratricopeptide repeat protein [Bacteroidia bacterium]